MAASSPQSRRMMPPLSSCTVASRCPCHCASMTGIVAIGAYHPGPPSTGAKGARMVAPGSRCGRVVCANLLWCTATAKTSTGWLGWSPLLMLWTMMTITMPSSCRFHHRRRPQPGAQPGIKESRSSSSEDPAKYIQSQQAPPPDWRVARVFAALKATHSTRCYGQA